MASDEELQAVPIQPRHRIAVGRVVRELLAARDFLALQLEEATGVIGREEFERRAAPHFARLRNRASVEDARQHAVDLFEVAELAVDAEELSVMLRTTVGVANALA